MTLPPVAAVLITLAILSPCLLLGFFSPAAAKIMVAAAIVTTSLWLAIDSSRLRVREFKSQLASHPFVLFTASLGLWILVFPTYLIVRSKIQAGLLPKSPNPRERYAVYLCIAVWSLPVIAMLLSYLVTISVAH